MTTYNFEIPNFCWPLKENSIRKHSLSNTFGIVRNGGKKAHQGWDLLAYPLTPCYAIADGIIDTYHYHKDYGNVITLEFERRGQTLYAAYCHLFSVNVGKNDAVRMGQLIGYTGNSGNASSMKGEDQHLHFEIRTVKANCHGLSGKLDPRLLYGFVPLRTRVPDTRLGNESTTKNLLDGLPTLGIKFQNDSTVGLKFPGKAPL
jgi:peptidoglycan LD-endopeptidase LytH